jgi:single-strand DNA-binding protein
MLNQAQIIGNLGRDPETRYLPSGEAVCNFSVATTERWKSKTGDQQESTEWHRINAFGKLAEICSQYLAKGSLVFVQGKITTRKWTDKDGVERYSTEIRAENMKMLGGKSDRPEQEKPLNQPAPKAASKAGSGFDDMDDDIPFN